MQAMLPSISLQRMNAKKEDKEVWISKENMMNTNLLFKDRKSSKRVRRYRR